VPCISLKRHIQLVAIDQLHRCGIIHCDIKPANVFIRLHAGDMHAVLGDYGHAHVAPPGADLARVAVTGLRGTPEYTAPEVCAHARGERRAFGAAADVFAFGVLIFAMLTAGKVSSFRV
jgi:serine/threonine-protein kinase